MRNEARKVEDKPAFDSRLSIEENATKNGRGWGCHIDAPWLHDANKRPSLDRQTSCFSSDQNRCRAAVPSHPARMLS